MSLKTESIEFKNGIKFKPSPITVIVGANNSGKTRFLKEVFQFLKGDDDFHLHILKDIKAESGDFNTIIKSLGITFVDEGESYLYKLKNYFGTINHRSQKNFIESLSTDVRKQDPFIGPLFRKNYGKACVAMIQTEDRLIAGKTAPVHPDEEGFLDTLYNEGSQLEITASKFTQEVFGFMIKLDFSNPGRLSLRIGESFSSVPTDLRDAKAVLQNYQYLEHQGDGIRSFITTLLMLLTTKRPYILLDEPEAFLHPPQAAALGRIIAQISNEHQSIIISTHSSDFLRGLITERSDIHVVRLARTENGTTAHLLATESIKTIINTPILNSTSVLSSLFYRGTVILEGDSDRTFYEKVARTYFPEDEIYYVHAHNKQTIHKLIPTNAKTAVPFAVIIDFDILRQREDLKKIIEATQETTNLNEILVCLKKIQDNINKHPASSLYKDLLDSLEIRLKTEKGQDNLEDLKTDQDQIAEQRIADLKSHINKMIDESDKWKTVKKLGIDGLNKEVKSDFEKLNTYCKQVGVFIVPCGSLESWLVPHGVPANSNNKSKWITNALVWLSENEPDSMPVRDFVDEIHEYLLSPKPTNSTNG